ncbi:MAG: RNA polymerase sigma factor (sigma-70 family), partial [Verrucomicrobiales bacterium]
LEAIRGNDELPPETEDAIERFMASEKRKWVAFAESLVPAHRRRAVAPEDLVTDALLTLIDHIRGDRGFPFSDRAKMSAFVMQAIKWNAWNWNRKNAKLDGPSVLAPLDDAADTDPFDQIAMEPEGDLIACREFLERLDPLQRKVVARKFCGLTLEEIAIDLEMTVYAVRVCIARLQQDEGILRP